MLTGVLYETRKKIRRRLNLPLYMIWAGRRDHLVVDMTPLAGMYSSLVGEARGSLECSSIQRTSRRMLLRKIEEKNKKKISTQRTLREAQKVLRLL